MSAKFAMLGNQGLHPVDEKATFLLDVLQGFSKPKKSLSSKYFYDEAGSELFNQITRHPDYYLTQSEIAILDHNKNELADLLANSSFNLVELGPGEGLKTQVLLNAFLKKQLSFSYYAIDISHKYLHHLVDKFNQETPDLDAIALNGDYLQGIQWLGSHSKKRNFLLFLGSSIGNFNLSAATEFLLLLRGFLHPGDYLLIGFDLLKEIDILLRAYNDNDGITRQFNLNLLKRMNRELGANFNLDSFYHYGTFNAYSKAMESYLISNKEQIVYFSALNKSFSFKEFEAIHVESSQKYTLSEINKLASAAQCKVVKNFTDSKCRFVNSLWQV
ncbi:MAG: L-histidine N(alpha)-methyltransferase [Tatlockia sp.]|jgi:dimethylhistidine N-methyltransferase